jgi:hypothetical protein
VRIPFPERVPIGPVAIFAVALFVIQSLEGTALYFSAGCVAFILIAALAFNVAGGLTRASGAYVFFYSMLVVIVGICYKAFLGEPGQSNLLDPRTDIAVYVGGITAMLGAAVVSRRLSRKSALLQNVLKDSGMYRAAVGCVVFGVGGAFIISLLGQSGAALNRAFTQLNSLGPLGIIIGVMYEIRRSGGTRSVNLPVALAAIYIFFFYGILGFSKQGMLLPFYCWLLPVCALGFRLSRLQIVSCIVGLFIIFHYLVPYSQYGRRFIEPNQTLGQKISLSMRLVEHPNQTRQNYEEDPGGPEYFNTPQGFWDRLQFISPDDRLNNITSQGRVFGWSPIEASFLNAIPRVLWPNKPDLNFGNLYAHEIGGISDEDTSTGISFSPTAEAYHMAKWVGVFVIAPLIWGLLFVVFDSLFGDIRTSPWGILSVALISHIAPESALTGAIYLMTFGTAILTFCAFFAVRIAPIFAIAVLGADRGPVKGQFSFRHVRTPH